MKRGSSNLHQFRGVDEQVKAKLEHQTLLNKYLERLKESVSRKRKLKNVKQKREALLGQVRFLRRRRRYLLKHHSHSEVDEDLLSQNSDVDKPLIEGKRNDTAYEAAAVGKNSTLRHEEGAGGRGEEEQIVREALRVLKAPRNYFTNVKRISKKKIMWQDQMTLKV